MGSKCSDRTGLMCWLFKAYAACLCDKYQTLVMAHIFCTQYMYSPFIKLCLGTIGMGHVINELCCEETILLI